jgi:hypothetical protein
MAAEIWRQLQMVHGEFRSEERRGHVEPSIFRLHLQTRVDNQGFDKIRIDTDRERIRTFVLPVPFGWDISVEGFVEQFGIEFQVLAQIAVDRRRKSPIDSLE